MKIESLCEKCRKAIEAAAYDSYFDGNANDFGGCACVVPLKGEDEISISCDAHGCHEVEIYKSDGVEVLNVERAIADYLDENANEYEERERACNNDPWRDVAPGCDPAFPHYGDFERWAYGR